VLLLLLCPAASPLTGLGCGRFGDKSPNGDQDENVTFVSSGLPRPFVLQVVEFAGEAV
jgi:hypothetical protein